MRRHFHIETRDPDEYDVSLNADRIPVGQCVDKIVARVRSESFAETGESRAKLGHLAIEHHLRAVLRTHASTSRCKVRFSRRREQ